VVTSVLLIAGAASALAAGSEAIQGSLRRGRSRNKEAGACAINGP